jgi:hypothetical protein
MGVELAVDAFDVFVDRAGRQYEAPGDALGVMSREVVPLSVGEPG